MMPGCRQGHERKDNSRQGNLTRLHGCELGEFEVSYDKNIVEFTSEYGSVVQ